MDNSVAKHFRQGVLSTPNLFGTRIISFGMYDNPTKMQSGRHGSPRLPLAVSIAGLLVSAGAAITVGLAGLGVFGMFRSYSAFGGLLGGYYMQMSGASTGTNTNTYVPWGMSNWGVMTWLWVPIIVGSIVIAALGVFMLNSRRVKNARAGMMLLLVGALLAFPTVFGFLIGSALMVLGAALRLIWWSNQETEL